MTKINFIFVFCLGLLLFSCQKDSPQPVLDNDLMKSSKALEVDGNGLSKAFITIKTVHGNIVFKLYPKHAPITVSRIVELTNDGFYNGLTFHRVVPGFVIQGGDPKGNGTGGSGKKLKAEFNDLQHVKGTVAMARSAGDENSADSQFYIAMSTLPHLDGDYTIFGQVVEGLGLVEKVQQGDKIISMSYSSEIAN